MQLVFTKTRILSVKVATLTTFLTMVKTLDQVCLVVFFYYPSLPTKSFLDKSDSETRAPSIKDTDQGASSHSQLYLRIAHSCVFIDISLSRWQLYQYKKQWGSRLTGKL
jgi:hypothetical protein